MEITKRSPISGAVYTMDLPITEAQVQRWVEGEHIQDAMPHLDADQREFLISGVLPGEMQLLDARDDGFD